ncbi:MAG: hypothetical protein ACHRHE_09460 [Tepidisphaerales bacterium]
MMRNICAGIVLAAVTAAVFAADRAEVSVKVVKVTDNRVQEMPGGASSDLTIRVRVGGDLVNGATAWGNVKFAEAVDDLGTDLRPGENWFADARREFHTVNPSSVTVNLSDVRSFEEALLTAVNKKPESGFEIHLSVPSPPRKAERIKRIKGEFQVTSGGEEKVVRIGGLKTDKERVVEDAQLKAAGLEVKILPRTKEDDDKTIHVEIRGYTHVIKKDDVLDAVGKSVVDGGSGGGWGHIDRKYYTVRTVEESFVVQLRVLVGQKTVTIPFEFTDVPLP